MSGKSSTAVASIAPRLSASAVPPSPNQAPGTTAAGLAGPGPGGPSGAGMARDSGSIRSPSIAIVRIVAAAMIAVILLAAGTVLLRSHRRELRQSVAALDSNSAMLAEQAARAIQSVELVVDDVTRRFGRSAPANEAALQQLASGREEHARLAGIISGIPQLNAVSVIGDDGRLLNFSRYYPIPVVNVADRDYFKALRDDARLTYLSAPVQNRGTGTWTIYLARRLSAPDGTFLGLVLGAIELSYFETFYEDAHPSAGSSITLWRDDGVLLARYPMAPGIGEQFDRELRFTGMLPGERRRFRVSDTVDHKERLVVITHLVGQPLVVGVTRTVTEALEDWRDDAIVVVICAGCCTAAVFAVMLFMIRQIRAHDALVLAVQARDTAEDGRRDAESKLLQAQKLDAIGQIAAGVAHDFNNLLMVIRGANEWLGRRLANVEDGESRLAMIEHAVDRGATLTRQMLASSRQQILSPAPIDLNAVVRSIRELLRSSLGDTNQLELVLADGLWPVLADRGQMEDTILNLVINARDAMPGGGTVRVITANHSAEPGDTAGTLPPGDYTVLTVSDTGLGMTPAVMARAFEPFFTTKERGMGSGLGLSQVAGFVRQSNGDVVMRSAPDEGTAVSLMLPRVEAEIVLPVQQRGSPPIMRLRAERSTVMVVDDDAAVRGVVVAMLQEHGMDVVQAATGTAAMLLYKDIAELGLVVTDFAMPGMTGAELARLLRESNPRLPVVFMTGYARPEPLAAESWVIRKPFTSQFLMEMITAALSGD